LEPKRLLTGSHKNALLNTTRTSTCVLSTVRGSYHGTAVLVTSSYELVSCTNAQRTSKQTSQPTTKATSHQPRWTPAHTEFCLEINSSAFICPVHSKIRDSRRNNRTTSAVGSLVVSLRYHWYSLQCTSIPTHPPDKRQARVSWSPLAGNLALTRNEQAKADDI
jgi:hypothetical protein